MTHVLSSVYVHFANYHLVQGEKARLILGVKYDTIWGFGEEFRQNNEATERCNEHAGFIILRVW